MKVSVIIPVYNAVSFVDRCIQSALDQPQTGEVIVIDDKSTDGSWEKCIDWQNKNGRVKLFKNEGLKGAGATRNVGLKNATCDFIAFLDADDYYLDGRFDEDEQLLIQHNSLSATANKVEIRTTDAKETVGLNALFCNYKAISFQNAHSKVDVYDFYKGSALHLNGLTMKSNASLRFDESLKQAQDSDFIIRLLLIGGIMSTDLTHSKAVYNIHSSNTISNISEAVFYRRKFAKKHFKLAHDYNLKQSVKWKLFKDFMEYDYLWYFGKSHQLKKFYKLIMLPFFVFRIYSKNDPGYDKDRTILLS